MRPEVVSNEYGNAWPLSLERRQAYRATQPSQRHANLHVGEARMNNHNHNSRTTHMNPGASWVGLLAGMLISLLIGGLTGALVMLLVAPNRGSGHGPRSTGKAPMARTGVRHHGRRGGVGPRQSPPDHARRG